MRGSNWPNIRRSKNFTELSSFLAQISKEEVYFDHHSAPATSYSTTYCDRNQNSKFLGVEDKCWWLSARSLLNGQENIGVLVRVTKFSKLLTKVNVTQAFHIT